jgi:hypothetical protein
LFLLIPATIVVNFAVSEKLWRRKKSQIPKGERAKVFYIAAKQSHPCQTTDKAIIAKSRLARHLKALLRAADATAELLHLKRIKRRSRNYFQRNARENDF